MARFSVLFVVTLFACLAFLPGVEATHEWGHRYMVFGRILDSEGDPVHQLQVRATVETTQQSDPVIPINTDCFGLYYTYNPNLDGETQSRLGMEAGVMHIHKEVLPSDARYRIMTDHGNASGSVRSMMHRSTLNFALDEDLPAKDDCNEVEDWKTTYVVQGRVQKDQGNARTDQMTIPDAGLKNEVEVTIETVDGIRNLTVETNRFGDYFAIFNDVDVPDNARITATWDGNVRTGSADLEYRVSEVNIITKDSISGTTVKVLLGIVGAAAIIGGAGYGISKYRENLETKKLRESGIRKRANR